MNEFDLEFFRMKARLTIIQRLCLDLHGLMQSMVGIASIQESVSQAVDELEAIGKQAETVFLSQHRNDAEAAVYADEFRQIVEEMKTHVASIPKRQVSRS